MASVSRDGRKAAISRGPVVIIIEMSNGNDIVHLDLHDEATSFAWLRDDQVLTAGTEGGRLYFLDPRTLREVEPRRLVAGGAVMALQASPDGRVMASLGTDGDLTLWDTASLHPYGKPVSDNHRWGILSFSNDSRTLRVFHETGRKVELDTDPHAWVREACAAANRDLTPEESALIRPGKPLRPTCEGTA
jgi:WD40 repeat protein